MLGLFSVGIPDSDDDFAGCTNTFFAGRPCNRAIVDAPPAILQQHGTVPASEYPRLDKWFDGVHQHKGVRVFWTFELVRHRACGNLAAGRSISLERHGLCRPCLHNQFQDQRQRHVHDGSGNCCQFCNLQLVTRNDDGQRLEPSIDHQRQWLCKRRLCTGLAESIDQRSLRDGRIDRHDHFRKSDFGQRQSRNDGHADWCAGLPSVRYMHPCLVHQCDCANCGNARCADTRLTGR